jgi:murein L,D-transpeptidase YafK
MRIFTFFISIAICLCPVAGGAEEKVVDLVFIDKSERRLELRREGVVIRSYQVALGGDPEGAKRQEGDQRTPEGHYVIDFRKADSAYHLALHISYPNAADRMASAALGVPTGGDIFIHGLPNYYPFRIAPKVDWTLGCIALDDAEIEEVWRLVPDGTAVTIVP